MNSSAGIQLYRDTRDRVVVRGSNDVDKIILPEYSILLKDFSAKSFDFLVDLFDTFGSFLNGFSAFRSEC